MYNERRTSYERNIWAILLYYNVQCPQYCFLEKYLRIPSALQCALNAVLVSREMSRHYLCLTMHIYCS